MTRKVTRRMAGSVASGEPLGQSLTAASVSSRIALKNARIRSPLSGGTKTRRCLACSGPSSTSTECLPTVAVNSEFASPECRTVESP